VTVVEGIDLKIATELHQKVDEYRSIARSVNFPVVACDRKPKSPGAFQSVAPLSDHSLAPFIRFTVCAEHCPGSAA